MRRNILFLLIAGVVVIAVLAIVIILRLTNQSTTSVPIYWPNDGWQTNTPEEQGLDSEKLVKAMQVIEDQQIPIDSLLIIRNGYVLLNADFYNPYDGTYPHDMASVTKSVMTTLIGIAVSQGKIDLDQKLVSFFPELLIANLDKRKEDITVRHLVGMVNGFESGCMGDDLGTLNRMRGTVDWVQSTLDRKMVQKPGTSFCYDSPGMHLLSAILQKSTGMTALDFAKQYLFGPLGIKDVIWETDPQGRTYGWGDLHLYPLDAAKIGYLFLNDGEWDGAQIVPAEWVKQATKAQVDAGEDSYGYGWWITDNSYSARGREGQNIIVVPSLNAIVVTTGSDFEYDQIDPYLSASVIDPSNPLPPNPAGVAQLHSMLEAFVKMPPALPASSLPNVAQDVSGKTYSFEPNMASISALKIEFTETDATIYQKRLDWDVTMRIGLDNNYQKSTDGSQMRGYWKDSQTFVIEKFDIGLSTIQVTFMDDRLELETNGIKLVGQVQDQ